MLDQLGKARGAGLMSVRDVVYLIVFYSLLISSLLWQVTLFTRGQAPINQQLPGETDSDYTNFAPKILHLKGDRKDFGFVKSSLSAEGFGVVYDINGSKECNAIRIDLGAIHVGDQGHRTTPSQICFTDSKSLVGEAASNQAMKNLTNSILSTAVVVVIYTISSVL
ncbi:hypothetical protein M0R45_006504 [Rubus argutus]|uniref:Uncharacterized protein n=1 Tax=Rubus argutus TaxID=59490 RepID=A0AAW1YQT9_RUBAR